MSKLNTFIPSFLRRLASRNRHWMPPANNMPGQAYKVRHDRLNYLVAILVISFTIIATGCSTLKQRAEGPLATTISPEAEALFNRLRSQNSQLQSFKGTGRMRIENQNGIQQARIMWAGYQNEKLRLEIMGATGQPVFSFAYDGERIYLISHTENRFYSKRSSDASLEKLISLPISVSDTLDLLVGRIPMEKECLPISVHVKEEGEQILVLKSLERKAGHQKITIDTASGSVRRIEAFDKDESLEYQAEFIRMQNVSGFEVPKELRFSDGSQASLQLFVERFWPNVALPESLFELDRPD